MTDTNIDAIRSLVMEGRVGIDDARALLGLLPISGVETEERRIAGLYQGVVRRARNLGLKTSSNECS